MIYKSFYIMNRLDILGRLTSAIFNLSKNVRRAVSTSAVPKEEKIKVGNWNINYVKVGNGAHHVLFLPGALGTIWTEAKPQVDNFNRENFTLVVWDPPGYGKSRPPEKTFTTDYYERDANMAYEFMKVLNIHKYSVLGFSDGGRTSLIHAAKYPDAVNKLVVWSSSSFVFPSELELMYKKIRDLNAWSKRMKKPLIKVYGEKLSAKYWAEWVDGQEAIVKTKNGNICTELLKHIKCPTYLLYGQKDPLMDSSHISYMQTHIDGSRIHLYPDGKHHIHLQYAEDFNQRVQEFLL